MVLILMHWAPLEKLSHRCRRARPANQLTREKTQMRPSGDSRWMDGWMDLWMDKIPCTDKPEFLQLVLLAVWTCETLLF